MRQRIRASFASTYLTIVSIIQGVALSTLYSTLESHYARLELADWLMAVATLLLIVATWHLYTINALAFAWTLSLVDSLVPFSLGAVELVVIRSIIIDWYSWLFALALMYGSAIFAYVNLRVRAERDPASAHVTTSLGAHWRWFHRWIVLLFFAQLSIWIGSWSISWNAFSPEALQIGAIALSGVFIVSILIQSIFYWLAVLGVDDAPTRLTMR